MADELAAESVDALAQDDLTAIKMLCRDTKDAYIEQIGGLQSTLSSVQDLTERLADSLAGVDPNMENGTEGKAFIRKMYKLRGEKADAVELSYPATP